MPKRLFEVYLLASRWLLAPFLVMMTAGLVALLIKAGKKTYGLVALLLSNDYDHITLQVLTLIDTMLIGALVMIVTVSVYENFISRISSEHHGEWPSWMGAIDFSQLKLKLMSTLVAISAIKLLEALIDASEISDRDMNYFIGVHVTFVASTLVLALSEKLSAHASGADARREAGH
ncbi:MAG TPA: YqhA family protein [Methylocystis sp.]|nr:YqhA family protein [Methylocystis sp.]